MAGSSQPSRIYFVERCFKRATSFAANDVEFISVDGVEFVSYQGKVCVLFEGSPETHPDKSHGDGRDAELAAAHAEQGVAL